MTNHQAAREVIKNLRRVVNAVNALITNTEQEFDLPEREMTTPEIIAMKSSFDDLRNLAKMLETTPSPDAESSDPVDQGEL